MNPTPEHILTRALIHFAFSGILLFMFTRIWAYAKRRATHLELYETIIIPALLILWTTAMREAYDVWNGGALIKSLFDFASWLLGVVVFGWVIWKTKAVR